MNKEELIQFLKDNLRIELYQEGHSFGIDLKLCDDVISSDYYQAF